MTEIEEWLFLIIVTALAVITILAIVFVVMFPSMFNDMHTAAVADCVRQNLEANRTVCLV